MSVEIIDNMPFNEYLSIDRLSASSLKNFQKSPAYYMQQKSVKKEPSDAMKLGTMIHTWMLENKTFHNMYYAIPKLDKRTKDGKAAYQSYLNSANGRELIDEKLVDRFTKLPIKDKSKNEVTVLWEHNGIKCKSRFDMLYEDGIEDLKTINNIFNIDRDFYKFGYHIQAGFYAQAFKEAFGKWPKFFNFTFISTDPEYFDLVTCPISFEYLELGRMRVLELIKKYQECKESGKYPGISSFEIETPSWL